MWPILDGRSTRDVPMSPILGDVHKCNPEQTLVFKAPHVADPHVADPHVADPQGMIHEGWSTRDSQQVQSPGCSLALTVCLKSYVEDLEGKDDSIN